MTTSFRFTMLLALAACASYAQADDAALYLPPLAAAERAAPALSAADFTGPRRAERETELRKHAPELQMLAMQRALVGDTDGAIAAFDAQAPAAARATGDAAGLGELADARAEDAVDAIVAQARTRRIVILNEAHHVPMHRAFAMRLAAALRKIGYTYLACETFDGTADDMSRHVPGHQVTTATGSYTRETTFANFVNAALADGWKLVGYDVVTPLQPGQDWMEQIGKREQAEADNLAARIFAKDKEARAFIYVGYAHGYKSPPGMKGDIDWMAERLRRATGVDILSIDQTTFYAHPDRGAEHPLYPNLLAAFPAPAPFVLRLPDGRYAAPGGPAGRVDMQVVYPRYASHDGRPDWLRTLAGRSPRAIPASLLPKQGRRIIKAFRVDAVKDAVPADVVVVEAGKPAPMLMLPSGGFRYAYEE